MKNVILCEILYWSQLNVIHYWDLLLMEVKTSLESACLAARAEVKSSVRQKLLRFIDVPRLS